MPASFSITDGAAAMQQVFSEAVSAFLFEVVRCAKDQWVEAVVIVAAVWGFLFLYAPPPKSGKQKSSTSSLSSSSHHSQCPSAAAVKSHTACSQIKPVVVTLERLEVLGKQSANRQSAPYRPCQRIQDAASRSSLLSAAVGAGQCEKAIQILKELAEIEPPSMRTYMTVIRLLNKHRDWKSAADLLTSMKAAGTLPDNLVLNNVLGLCVSVEQTKCAEALMEQWQNIADVISCNILLKGYSQQAVLPKAENLLEKMMKFGPSPNVITFNTVMDCAVRSMQVRNVAVSSRSDSHSCMQIGGATASTASALPSSVVAMRRPWELLEKLLSLGLEPDRYTCSTLVKGMHLAGCRNEDVDRAVQLLRSIGAEALHSPSVTNANAFGNTSSTCNIRLLEVLFNTLLDACASIHDLDRMAQVFELMQEFKVCVSAVTFGTLIKAFGQEKRIQHCHEVWQRMLDSDIRPTIVTFGCYIDACVRNEEFCVAEQIFQDMRDTGQTPNAVIFSSLIRGFASVKQPLKALHFYNMMKADAIEVNAATFTSILDVIARQLSDPAMLQEVIDDMHHSHASLDVTTYSVLVKSSSNVGNLDSALALYRQTCDRGLVLDQVAFNSLLLACSKADRVDEAKDIFQNMCESGVAPSHVTTSILVKMYGKARLLDKAIALSDFIETQYGQMPNLYVYTCLIQACVHNRQARQSWNVFERMLRSGIKPDAITYGTMIHGCIYNNRLEQAMSLVRQAYGLSASASLPGQLRPQTSACEAVLFQEPVHLQAEVLKSLNAALKRKDLAHLVSELEVIVSNNVADSVIKRGASNEAAKGNWSSRKARLKNGAIRVH